MALDIVRCRELGVPRYCEFRRLLHLPVPQTFEEVTSNKVWASRHCPELAPTVTKLPNAFGIWDRSR